MLHLVTLNQNPPFPTSPLERVREGMLVIDERGRRLGKVKRMRLGYPEAVSADLEPRDVNVLSAVVGPLGTGGTDPYGAATPMLIGPELPEEVRLELLRSGYIEVDGPGLRGLARYIHGDQIANVSGNTVIVRGGGDRVGLQQDA